MYDVNPDPQGEMLSLNVSPDSNLIDIDLAIDTAMFYGISSENAKRIASDICLTVRENWEHAAKRNHIDQQSIDFMRPAFLASKWKA